MRSCFRSVLFSVVVWCDVFGEALEVEEKEDKWNGSTLLVRLGPAPVGNQ